MRIVVAPDSFKGSLSAMDVASAMEKGIHAVFPEAQVSKVPIADGGEGTVEALVAATGGRIIHQQVMGPLGDRTQASWGLLGDGETAVIEMAAASGITLIPAEKRNPRVATTYGTGQLIQAALDQGIKKIIIGIGGSATNDGGAGMAQALGVKFLDVNGQELSYGGAALAQLETMDTTHIDSRLAETTILVASDVDNPLCGDHGASAVYGPQKGATPEIVAELDQALKHYAEVAKKVIGKDVLNLPGAGAAGGLGAGLMIFTQAKLRPGVEIVLEACDFSNTVKHADLVMTGEGNTDFQTAHGKAPVGIAQIAKQYGVPVVCLSGGLGKGCDDVLRKGIDALMGTVPRPMELTECMAQAGELLQEAAARVCRLIQVGFDVSSRNR
ncbi:glycerate kinase [Sporomusaceae bacterium BoRhaA]|uniref:glycerate kinase n=1 Tax=Pelorhabdus rhamnosifermentans TaxID=2772457 RepID=UPI001C0614B3|nr:glycerate kinase [Pelorhabdus rhamnosifermentans]MBU2704123.1 glycerate kinase [Pelorhabdus rhamnosifermentans]